MYVRAECVCVRKKFIFAQQEQKFNENLIILKFIKKKIYAYIH